MEKYDSTEDTLNHIATVIEYGDMVIENLKKRYKDHDQSKLFSPEKKVFDEYTPKLKHSTYGTEEYTRFLKGMDEALSHHYENNDHHPEHVKHLYCPHCETSWYIDEEENLKGVCPLCAVDNLFITGDLSSMSLLSLMEMITDWKVATLRHDDGDIVKSLTITQERFGYSDDIRNILYNTIKEMGWINKTIHESKEI